MFLFSTLLTDSVSQQVCEKKSLKKAAYAA